MRPPIVKTYESKGKMSLGDALCGGTVKVSLGDVEFLASKVRKRGYQLSEVNWVFGVKPKPGMGTLDK